MSIHPNFIYYDGILFNPVIKEEDISKKKKRSVIVCKSDSREKLKKKIHLKKMTCWVKSVNSRQEKVESYIRK